MKKIVFILIAIMLFITGCKTQQDPQKKLAQQAE
jgi:PBP1b-binding outer membrane lipoprotein LpoB